MNLSIRTSENTRILDIGGDVDLRASPLLRKQLFEALKESPKVVINLTAIRYIDSSGIGELVSGFTSVANQGGTLKLLGLTKRVKDLLQITKLYTVFDVHEDEAHAIRSFV